MGSILDGIDWGSVDVDALARVLSGSAKSSAEGNIAEGNYLNARDRIKAELYNTQQQASTRAAQQALDNAKFTTALPGQGFGETVRGSLAQNLQDVTPVYGGASGHTLLSYTGGARPSALGPEVAAAGQSLAAHGSSLLNDPNSFLPTTGGPMAPPALSEEPKAGFWGKAASAGATAAGLANALNGGKSGNNLGDILNKLFHRPTGGQNNQPYSGGALNYPGMPNMGFEGWAPNEDDYGRDPNGNYGPEGSVSTSTDFSVPGGYANNPEDPMSRVTDWWSQLPLTDQNSAEGAGGNVTGTDWWDE